MFVWSSYNKLFRSERSGRYLLYNALSNRLLEVDDAVFSWLNDIESNGGCSHVGSEYEQHLQLFRESSILLRHDEERDLLRRNQYRRTTSCHENKELTLTVCPTLACNFECSYCFEHTQSDRTVISECVIDDLIAFIKNISHTRNLKLYWYGGEPTLVFDRIEQLTHRLLNEGYSLKECQLITNGYLLDRKKTEMLNELGIETLQITLDGPRQVHDSRRTLMNNIPTFDRILQNIESLLDSSYTGSCNIRVNIDNTNKESFVELHQELTERFADKRVVIYPSYIVDDPSTGMTLQEWVDFCLELYWNHGILIQHVCYPSAHDHGLCIAHYRNQYVFGPNGEVYKCWQDVGNPGKVAGTVRSSPDNLDEILLSRYSTGTDLYCHDDCRNCPVLPICTSVCPKKLLDHDLNIQENEAVLCSHFKTSLKECLEVIFDKYTSREMSRLILNQSTEPLEKMGRRIIYQEKEE